MKGVMFFAFLILVVPSIYADESTGVVETSCTYRTSCLPEETCWYKLSNLTNGHVASCTSGYEYSLCCTHTVEAALKTSCNIGENDVLLFGEDGTLNAHAGDMYSPYATHLCIETREETELDCEVVLKGSEEDGYACFTGMSSTSNAHAASCNYETYNYALFCKSRERVYTNHTFQITLTSNSLSDTIQVPRVGQLSHAQLQTQSYEPVPAYLEASNSNRLHAVIGTSGTTSVATQKDATSYSLILNQQQEANKAALVFGRGDLELFLANMAQMERNNYDTTSVKTFGFRTENDDTTVKQGIVYDQITFRGSDTLSPGTHQLQLEHLGTRDKKILVKIAVVR